MAFISVILSPTHPATFIYCAPQRAATYFCLGIREVDLSGILFGHLEVCFAVLPVPSPRRIAPYPC